MNHQQSEKSRNQLTEFKLRIKQLLIDFGLDESQSIDAISHIYSDKCSLIIEMEEQQSRKNDEVNSIVSALKDKVDDLMARNSNDTKLLSQREQDIEALRSELLLIQNEFDNMVNKENKDINLIQHYETLLKESHSTIDQNLSKIKELKFVTMNQSVELKEHHILMRGLKDEFESCEAGLDSECLKLIDTIKSLELQAVESDALLESLNLNISDLHHVIETQSLELKAKNSLICCMRDEFESCEAGLDSECMKLMDKIEILEEQVVSHKELAVEKCELNTKLVNLMGELRESNHTIERQSKDIDQLKYNIQEIDNDQNKKELTESRDALVHENSLALIQLESLQKHLTDKVNDLHLKTGQLNNIEIKYAQSRKTISNFESALLTAQKMLEDEQSATGQEINKSNSLQLQIDSLSLSQSDHILTIKRLEASIDSQMSEMEIIKQIQIESKRLEKEKSSQLFDLIQANDISKALNTKLVEQNDESIVVIAKIQSSLDESLMYNESIKVKTTHELVIIILQIFTYK